MRYTEYYAGKAVIKDRSLLAEAMEKLARLEDAEDTNVPGKWIPITEKAPEDEKKMYAKMFGVPEENVKQIPREQYLEESE